MIKYYEELLAWHRSDDSANILEIGKKDFSLSTFIYDVDEKAKEFQVYMEKDHINGLIKYSNDKYHDLVDFYAACKAGITFGFIPHECRDDELVEILQGLKLDYGKMMVISNTSSFHVGKPSEKAILGHLAFSSGTGSYRSCILRTAESWMDNFQFQNKLFGLNENKLGVLGSIAYSGNFNICLGAIYARCTILMLDDLSLNGENPSIDTLYVVPTVLKKLMKRRKEMFSNITTIVTAGERLSVSLAHHVLKEYPKASFIDFYGSVEVSYVAYRDLSKGKYQEDSVGHLFPKVSIRIIDDVIHVNSPYLSLQNDDYVSTHDLGRLNDKELLMFGRKGDVISSRGKMISLNEIEKKLSEIPEITNVAALRVKDKERGENFDLVVEGVINESKIHNMLEKYGLPRKVVQVKSMPQLSSGKMDRKKLRELIQ